MLPTPVADIISHYKTKSLTAQDSEAFVDALEELEADYESRKAKVLKRHKEREQAAHDAYEKAMSATHAMGILDKMSKDVNTEKLRAARQVRAEKERDDALADLDGLGADLAKVDVWFDRALNKVLVESGAVGDTASTGNRTQRSSRWRNHALDAVLASLVIFLVVMVTFLLVSSFKAFAEMPKIGVDDSVREEMRSISQDIDWEIPSGAYPEIDVETFEIGDTVITLTPGSPDYPYFELRGFNPHGKESADGEGIVYNSGDDSWGFDNEIIEYSVSW
ncbi:hypothetical protein [Citricoccus nitrophenolicus]|uniref:hypothetical protein n=1 Tax=Citricoccus nitrophenolicus TaxID=863575 RepID=UPI0031F0067D